MRNIVKPRGRATQIDRGNTSQLSHKVGINTYSHELNYRNSQFTGYSIENS